MSSPLTRAIDLLDSTALFLESYAIAFDDEQLHSTASRFINKADELRKAIAELNEVKEPV